MGAMSDTVIDFVRRPQAQRRGGELQQVTFDTAFLNELPDTAAAQQGSVLESDRALSVLEALDPDLAELVELRFYGGYTDVEVGQALAASRWAPQPGDRLGSYRLIEQVGLVGMASVWRAQQTQGVLREVALKLPLPGLETAAATAARFAQCSISALPRGPARRSPSAPARRARPTARRRSSWPARHRRQAPICMRSASSCTNC